MVDLVLDANIVLKWILTKDEQLVEEARKLHDLIIAGKVRAFAPELMLVEVANVMFWKQGYKNADILEFLNLLRDGRIVLAGWEKFEWKELLGIMKDYKLTIYDAYYVYLAKKNNCKMVTLDEKLHRAQGYVVRLENVVD